MGEEIHEECGICGVKLKPSCSDRLLAPWSLITMNYAQNHRGQKSSGILTYNPLRPEEEYNRETMVRHKGLGMVSEVFMFSQPAEMQKIIEGCQGLAGVGHDRYSTSGRGRCDFLATRDGAEDETQPFFRRHARPEKRMGISYNGNMANYDEMQKAMKKKGYPLETNVDTEIWMNLLSSQINLLSGHSDEFQKPNLFKVMQNALKPVDGASNLLVLFGDGDLLAYRGGFHPLVYGQNEFFHAFASESLALESVGISEFRDLRPGEAAVVNDVGVKFEKIAAGEPFCNFEDDYFMHSASSHDLSSVRRRRRILGENLARDEPLKDRISREREKWVVLPSPKTAIPAGEAYGEALGLRVRQSIEKRDKRGFINPPEMRKLIMEMDYIFHEDVEGLNVIVVDDSIVRGETSRRQVEGLRKKGAIEVHIRLTEPPIRFPCYYGIDFPFREELLVNKVDSTGKLSREELEEKVAEEIRANSVRFQTIEGLASAISTCENGHCFACLNGNYPTPYGRMRAASALGR